MRLSPGPVVSVLFIATRLYGPPSVTANDAVQIPEGCRARRGGNASTEDAARKIVESVANIIRRETLGEKSTSQLAFVQR